jgi:predicted DsbA family dithiol-disulfide isomerase
MKIQIWSDVVCPWCYVGKRNLERALERFDHADEVTVEWKSYELDPEAPATRPGGYVERIANKYGLSLSEARARMARIVSLGADAGIEFRFDDARPGSTFDAHRLLHLAAELGRQDELKTRLFAAMFTEGEPIGDHDTLAKLAVDVGLPEADVRRVLDGRGYADAVRQDEVDAMELGVRGVPFFVIDERYGVSGAQAPDTFVTVLERAWNEANPVAAAAAVDDTPDAACDADACEW